MIAIIFTLILSAAAVESQEKPEWYTCQKDSDCATTTYLCDIPKAINKTHVKDLARHLKTIPGECMDEPLKIKPERATCLNSTCQLLFKVE